LAIPDLGASNKYLPGRKEGQAIRTRNGPRMPQIRSTTKEERRGKPACFGPAALHLSDLTSVVSISALLVVGGMQVPDCPFSHRTG
jgi:hypothetical protein